LSAAQEARRADKVEAVAGTWRRRGRGKFSLVYLVFKTSFNRVTQDLQVACFENAASRRGR
jgi:hypothetical protein